MESCQHSAFYIRKGYCKLFKKLQAEENLCTTWKIFEKLILKRKMAIQEPNDVDLTNHKPHVFKQGKSMSTLSITLPSMVARALDEDNYVLV
jgi:hypothetical protein